MSGVKTCFFILFFGLFMHAYDARLSAVSISHRKFNPNKDGDDKVGFSPKKVKDLCNKDRETQATKSENGDCMSSLPKALLHPPKSQGSRWPHDLMTHANVRDMDLHPSFFTEEDLTETDYQPPRRKSPIHNK